MSTTFIPDASAIEQPSERRYNSLRGWQTIRRWKGGQTAIEAKALETINAGYEIAIRQGPVWELEATIGADAGSGNPIDEPVDVWELTGNAVEKDLLQADIAAVANLNVADYKLLRDIFDGKTDAEKYKTSNPAWAASGSGSPQALFDLWCAGTKAITIYQPILRHTKTVSRGYELPASVADVGEVFTTARLATIEPIPGWIIASMPASSNVSKPGYASAFTYGWLKGYPQITLAAFSKSQIIQEWQWGLWPVVLYTINS